MIVFEKTYGALPEHFFSRATLTHVKKPRLIRLNKALAKELRIDPDFLASSEGTEMLAGNCIPKDTQPIALAYAGHQFGHFVPKLGDGRALLLGEIIDTNGKRRDIQLKGSGPTIFSRQGDGRAALGPVLREYIVSEAMAALSIPTTRSLAAVETGEMVIRDRALPGAVLTRVANSHIRIGTFQYFAAMDDNNSVRLLADYVINRHYREAANSPSPYLELLNSVIAAQARLIAAWQSVGFVHGVMNTDNMSVAGETIDYGPCAFMDSYDPATVFSSIDKGGRYAYRNQPSIALWNLARFAETLLPLLADAPSTAITLAEGALANFEPLFAKARLGSMSAKLGLSSHHDSDAELIQELLDLMEKNGADYTLTFRYLSDSTDGSGSVKSTDLKSLFKHSAAFDDWLIKWRARLVSEHQTDDARSQTMRKVNPLYIPRSHIVEEALDAAINHQKFDLFEKLVDLLETPFDDVPGFAYYARPSPIHQGTYKTFCGT